MCGPSCVLTFWVAKAWDKYRETAWRSAIGAGLAPVTVGFVCSSAFVLVRAADTGWKLAIVTAVTAAVAYFTKLNPLWCLLAAGVPGGWRARSARASLARRWRDAQGCRRGRLRL